MIDMNGSIESIMQECDRIAFNEFKKDIEAPRTAEKNASKMHNARGHATLKKGACNTKNIEDHINGKIKQCTNIVNIADL